MRKRGKDPITFDEFMDQVVDLVTMFCRVGKFIF